MRIKVNNFGPIRRANIALKPLTILVGKNNTGKSYFAQLLYVILTVFRDYPHRVWMLAFRGTPGRIATEDLLISDYETKRLTKQVKTEKLSDYEIAKRAISLVLNMNARIVQRALKSELERGFGQKIGRLVNINSSVAQIECDIFKKLTLEIQLTKRNRINVRFSIKETEIKRLTSRQSALLEDIKHKRKKKSYIEKLTGVLQDDLMELKRGFPFRLNTQLVAFYIPAGRGGLIESYDTVVEGLIFRSPLAPVFGLTMPPLPGMAAQFYNDLRRLEGDKGPLSEVVSKPFKELMEGDIRLVGVRLRIREKPLRTKMVYRFNLRKSSSVDLIHAASMVKELAPIYLVTKELIHPGHFLIIEEPESHLHPGAQFKLAGILATLVRNEVNVVLTTHSLTMLRKFPHFIGKKPTENESFLDFNSIAIYLLKKGKLGSASKILKISEHGALDSIPTFDEVVNELYDEELTLQSERED